MTKYDPIIKRVRSLVMAVEKTMASSSLAEVIDRILDKGIVVDAWARISLVGIELLAIEARIVVAGVDTYLKYAEAVGLTVAAQEA
jgi:gas vesicle structural protein